MFQTRRFLLSANPENLSSGDRIAYERVVEVANGLVNGTIKDPTNGALFFTANTNTRFFFATALTQEGLSNPWFFEILIFY